MARDHTAQIKSSTTNEEWYTSVRPYCFTIKLFLPNRTRSSKRPTALHRCWRSSAVRCDAVSVTRTTELVVTQSSVCYCFDQLTRLSLAEYIDTSPVSILLLPVPLIIMDAEKRFSQYLLVCTFNDASNYYSRAHLVILHTHSRWSTQLPFVENRKPPLAVAISHQR